MNEEVNGAIYRIDTIKGSEIITEGTSHPPPPGEHGEWVLYFAAENHALASYRWTWILVPNRGEWKPSREEAVATLISQENARHESRLVFLAKIAEATLKEPTV